MGHPIDPSDPANGGCNNCIYYLPEFLHMTYHHTDEQDYTGFLQRLVVDPSTWSGIISAEPPDDFFAGVQFCRGGTNDALVTVFTVGNYTVPDAHCNMPLGGEGPGFGLFLITVDQPDP